MSSQIIKKFIASNAVDGSKLRFNNDQTARARNAANNADVDLFKLNASDRLVFSTLPQVTSDPSNANDLVRLSYLNSALEGLNPKEAVRAVATSNVDISDELENADTIDGVTLATGDRVLLIGQTDPIENGIYVVVASGAASRSSDMNLSAEFPGAYTVAREGTANAGKAYVCNSPDSFVMDTDPATFVLFKSAATLTGHDMITISGDEVSVDLAAISGLESTNPGNAGGELRIKLEASNPSLLIDGSNQLGAKLDAAGAIESGASGLAVQVAAAGAIEIASNELQINLQASNPTLAITANELGVKFSATTSGLEATAAGLSIDLEASNPSLEINGSNELKAKFNTAAGIDSGASGLAVQLDAAGGLEFNSGDIRINVDATNSTTKVNASNELEAIKFKAEEFDLDATDITNQYIDLAFAARASDAISLQVIGGPIQPRGVAYTISLTGGAGGVTRITFAGDLATAGAAELEDTDILVVSYEYL